MSTTEAPTISTMAKAYRQASNNPDAFRAVMRASREARGDDLHEVVKSQAMTLAFGHEA